MSARHKLEMESALTAAQTLIRHYEVAGGETNQDHTVVRERIAMLILSDRTAAQQLNALQQIVVCREVTGAQTSDIADFSVL